MQQAFTSLYSWNWIVLEDTLFVTDPLNADPSRNNIEKCFAGILFHQRWFIEGAADSQAVLLTMII